MKGKLRRRPNEGPEKSEVRLNPDMGGATRRILPVGIVLSRESWGKMTCKKL